MPFHRMRTKGVAMKRRGSGLVKKSVACILLSLCVLCGQANGNVIRYEVLYSGDTVRWEEWPDETNTLRAFFVEDMSRFSRQLNARKGGGGRKEGPMAEYSRHVLAAHSILNNFFVQLLTYEERQAVFNVLGLSWHDARFVFMCLVDTNGRVSSIPYFDVDRAFYDAGYFRGERLYELARYIKNNVQFPLPPVSMPCGAICLEAGIRRNFHNEYSGVLFQSFNEYD